MRLLITTVVISVSTGLAPPNVYGQTPVTPVPIKVLVTATKFGEYQPLRFSPDGRSVIYALRDLQPELPGAREGLATRIPWYGSGSTLWMIETATGNSAPLMKREGSSWLASWSPDGQHVAFFSGGANHSGAELWVKDIRAGTERKLSDILIRPGAIQWTPDGQEVLVAAYPEHVTGQQFADRIFPPTNVGSTKLSPGSTVKVLEFDPEHERTTVGRADPWNLDSNLADLGFVDVVTGKAVWIASGKSLGGYWLSPDGSKVAFAEYLGFEKAGSQQILFDLDVFDRKTDRLTVVARHIRLGYDGAPVEWLPLSTSLSFRSGGVDGTGDVFTVDLSGRPPHKWTNFAPDGRGQLSRDDDLLWDSTGSEAFFTLRGELWHLTLSNGKASLLTKLAGHQMAILSQGCDQVWSTDAGRSIVAVALDNVTKKTGFYKIDENGRAEELWETQERISSEIRDGGLAVSADGKHIVYASQDAQHSSDLWINDLTFRNPRRLTHINPELDKYMFGAARLVEWRSADGQALHGALLLPAGYSVGQRYPVVVWVYPNIAQSDALNQFGFVDLIGLGTMQLLATRGYAVFLPDAPTKLGTAAADLMKSVLPGVDRLIEIGIADPDRIGIIGHSNGGYSVLALVVQTTRFRAAIVGDGLADWIASYGAMSSDGSAFGIAVAEAGSTGIGGTPWQARDRYIENSPVFYLDRVQTPVFIFHGSEDNAVPVHLGDEIFVDLRRLGKTVTYARYVGENHSPDTWKIENRIDLAERMITWFDKYLKVINDLPRSN
jgi:dipeptidyl aminopeptidase/acylaminoacyl peptidase